MYDVIALGELLIDFAPYGTSEQGNALFEVCPGGAPCNMLAMLQKLGHKTAFIGKVGRDMFGDLLRETLRRLGIDSCGLSMDEQVHTTLTFVHKLPNGDRDFSFYRNPGADMMLTADDVPTDRIAASRIFHFGTLSMTSDCAAEATARGIAAAKAAGCLCSFDPNLRPPLWDSMERAREKMHYGFDQCDILKIADNELQFATGETDFDAGVRRLQKQYGIPLILLTLGKDGSRAYFGDLRVDAPAFLHDKVADTTGAGDTFCACALHHVLEHGMDFTAESLREMLTFANAAASLITMRKGAMCAMPAAEEVATLVRTAKTDFT